MIYTGDLLQIQNKSGDFVTIPHLVSYKVGRAKLWKDSERNMSGDVRATLIGIFPKIELEIGYTDQDELKVITELLDQEFFEVKWFDVRHEGVYVGADGHAPKYYAGDYTVELDSKTRGRYKPFSVSLVPVSKRRY